MLSMDPCSPRSLSSLSSLSSFCYCSAFYFLLLMLNIIHHLISTLQFTSQVLLYPLFYLTYYLIFFRWLSFLKLQIQLVCISFFFFVILSLFQITDGGTYMSLLNTVANLSHKYSSVIALFLIDHLRWQPFSSQPAFTSFHTEVVTAIFMALY